MSNCRAREVSLQALYNPRMTETSEPAPSPRPAAKFAVKDWDPSKFPSLYRCADDASKSAQRCYLRWVRINLGLLILGAFVGSISGSDVAHKRVIQSVAATCFFLSVCTTVLLASRRWEKIWYSGRAVAESVKSLTWKFMAGADPFSVELVGADAVRQFTDTLAELMRENRHLAATFCGQHATAEYVTPLMTEMRGAAVGVVRDVYLSQRVNDQQVWYAESSAANQRYRNIWFAMLVLFQGAALATAIFLIVNPTFPWRASAVFTTLASATIAWGQLKRFQELAQAYGLAALELGFIAVRAPHVRTRADLARFVNDAETAISREHAMWVARRETK